MTLFLQLLNIVPVLVTLLADVWTFLNRVSHGRPEELLLEIQSSLKELNDAETEEQRKLASRRIAMLWTGK